MHHKQPDIHLASNTDQALSSSYAVTNALELLEDVGSQLAFLRSSFVGSEPKELSEIEQHGLCLMLDHMNGTITAATNTLKSGGVVGAFCAGSQQNQPV